jgi:hypothetical protein
MFVAHNTLGQYASAGEGREGEAKMMDARVNPGIKSGDAHDDRVDQIDREP